MMDEYEMTEAESAALRKQWAEDAKKGHPCGGCGAHPPRHGYDCPDLPRVERIVAQTDPATVTDDVGFLTKDSGQRVDFSTGSRRDDSTGKGRFDLLPFEALLRWAQLMERGAAKYGERNWELGQPMQRVMQSMLRHALQAAAGHTDEDHLSAVLFNAAALITFEERIRAGRLPADLDDRPQAA